MPWTMMRVRQGFRSPRPADRRPHRRCAVTRGTLVWFGLGFVLLSFFAAFLGSWLARSVDTAEPAPSAVGVGDAGSGLRGRARRDPAGRVGRAGGIGRAGGGQGVRGRRLHRHPHRRRVPLPGRLDLRRQHPPVRRREPDRRAGAGGRAGCAGSGDGPQGEQGERRCTGPSGAPGAPGTQVTLGTEAPDDADCTADGDVFIDTATVQFYECTDGAWALFGPTPDRRPSRPSSRQRRVEAVTVNFALRAICRVGPTASLQRRPVAQPGVPHRPQFAARPQHARGLGEHPRRDALVHGRAGMERRIERDERRAAVGAARRACRRAPPRRARPPRSPAPSRVAEATAAAD